MINVAVLGARGRMGSEVVKAVEATEGLALVAALDLGDSLDQLKDSAVNVVVDFTTPDSVMSNLEFLINNGINVVVGTTGFDAARLGKVAEQFKQSEANVIIAPNFGLAAVLMMQFAQLAAPYFESAEIIELHHPRKADAPSGTAVATAQRMAAASSEWAKDPTTHEAIPGARGAKGPGNIPIHAVRMRGVVANQEVILGTQSQTLTIRHDTIDRASFMPGVVLACKKIAEHKGLTLGLDSFLGI